MWRTGPENLKFTPSKFSALICVDGERVPSRQSRNLSSTLLLIPALERWRQHVRFAATYWILLNLDQSTEIVGRVHEILVTSTPGETSNSRQSSKRPPKHMLQWLPGQSLTNINVGNDEDLAETQLTSGMAAIHYGNDSNSNVSACPRKQQDSCTDARKNLDGMT